MSKKKKKFYEKIFILKHNLFPKIDILAFVFSENSVTALFLLVAFLSFSFSLSFFFVRKDKQDVGDHGQG